MAQKTKRNRLRSILLQIHLWLGLTLGIYFAMMGITGSILVFAEELKPVLNPELYHVVPQGEPMPWEKLLASFRAEYPNVKISRLLLPHQPDEAMVLWIGDWGSAMPIAYLNPYTGMINGERTLGGTIVGFCYYLHIYLYIPEHGFLINGILGLITLAILATGLYLWWPNQVKLLARRLWVAWRSPWSRINWDIHHAVGIWALPVLLLIILTGIAFPFWEPVESAVKWLLPEEPKQTAALVEAADESTDGESKQTEPRQGERDEEQPAAKFTLDELIATAKTAVPSGPLFLLSAVDNDRRPLYALFFEPGGENWYRYVSVEVSRETNEVVKVSKQESSADVVMGSMFPLHTGRFGGIWTKSLYAFVGMTPTILLVSGVLIWLRRKRQKRQRIKQRQLMDEADAADVNTPQPEPVAARS